MNVCILLGRLTKEVELKDLGNKKSVANISLAVKREYGSEVDFINVTVWNQNAIFLSKYATKGDLISIRGRTSVNSYEIEGDKRYTQVVVGEKVSLYGKVGSAKESNEEATETKTTETTSDYDAPF